MGTRRQSEAQIRRKSESQETLSYQKSKFILGFESIDVLVIKICVQTVSDVIADCIKFGVAFALKIFAATVKMKFWLTNEIICYIYTLFR